MEKANSMQREFEECVNNLFSGWSGDAAEAYRSNFVNRMIDDLGEFDKLSAKFDDCVVEYLTGLENLERDIQDLMQDVESV